MENHVITLPALANALPVKQVTDANHHARQADLDKIACKYARARRSIICVRQVIHFYKSTI